MSASISFKHPVTIVSAYYQFSNKKRGHGSYKKLMKYFLPNVAVPLVIVTQANCLNHMLTLRKAHIKNTQIIVKDFALLNEYRRYPTWQQEHQKDPEKNIHSPNHYIIWNEKLHLMQEAYKLNPFDSQWFIWMDIGAFRNKRKFNDLSPQEIMQWPSLKRLETLPKDKIILTKTDPTFDPSGYSDNEKKNIASLRLKTHNHVGALFIIHSSAIQKIHSTYYQLLEQRLAHNMFVGKEQNNFACLSIAYPELVHLLTPPPQMFPWYYIHHYLSDTRNVE